MIRNEFPSFGENPGYVGPFDDYPTVFEDTDEPAFNAPFEQESPLGILNHLTMDEPLAVEPISMDDQDMFEIFRSEDEITVTSDVEPVFESEQRLLTFEFPVASAEEIGQPEQEFEMKPVPVMENSETIDIVRHDLYSELPPSAPIVATAQPASGFSAASQPMSPEDEMYIQSRERIMRLREISMRIQSPSGLADMEKEPAYRRRNVKLDDVTPSSESNVSRYTLSVEENRPEIRSNNSFLHDRVD
jgi:cell division protein FtsZ